MVQKRIFISYRRSDSGGHAGRLYDYLKSYFGADRLFFDVDTIQIGTNFQQKINTELDNSDAVLVLIGNQWLEVRNKDGSRRLNDPNDYVRLEVATALSKSVVVIPILLQGSQMPSARELPDVLCDLSLHNAIRLNDDHWSSDCNLLAGILKHTLHVTRSLKEAKIRRYRSYVFILAALTTLLAIAILNVPFFTNSDIVHLVTFVATSLLLLLPVVNVAFITYLLGNIKKDLDRFSWTIIGLSIIGGYMVALGSRFYGWTPVPMILVAGLLNFVEPDE